MKRGAFPWLLFGAGASLVAAALLGVSLSLRRLERAETEAIARARHEQNLRLALWRMDSAVSLLLAREAERPPADYEAYAVVPQAILRRDLAPVTEEVIRPSPLLGERPQFIRIHFQVTLDGEVASPRIPAGNYLDKAQAEGLATQRLEEDRRLLERVRAILPRDVGSQVVRAEEWTRSKSGREKRAQLAVAQRVVTEHMGESRGTGTGPFQLLWAGDELLAVRRAGIGAREVQQGFLVDWEGLRASLLEAIADLFPRAALRPVSPEEESDRRLFTLPVVLETPGEPALPAAGWTPSSTLLVFTWAGAIAAGAAVALAVRRTLSFGERQRRFASLVTHELRSPLTAFRLYADLLGEGLVKDKERVAQVHATLRNESGHMARMVENVIVHARLEEGRARFRRDRVGVAALLGRLAPDLRAQAERAGLQIAVEAEGVGGAQIETDSEAIGQILGNLVDNACKYGRSSRAPAIVVLAATKDGKVRIAVRDYGPGIPAERERKLFRPFERGEVGDAEPVRGLGLGLALARGLARDLGGDLSYQRAEGGGASFLLTLSAVEEDDDPLR
jgi:signal transduction histidine kinase